MPEVDDLIFFVDKLSVAVVMNCTLPNHILDRPVGLDSLKTYSSNLDIQASTVFDPHLFDFASNFIRDFLSARYLRVLLLL